MQNFPSDTPEKASFECTENSVISSDSRREFFGSGASGREISAAGQNQPRTYLLNQSMVRCHARSAAALLYRSGVASQLKPCPAPW